MSYYAPDQLNAPKGPSPWKAILRVIYEPKATFQEFQEFQGRVPVFPGYLVQMLLGMVGFFMVLPMTLRILEQTMAANPLYTPELMAISKWSGIIGGGAMVLIMPWLAGLFTALIAMFFGQFQEERVGFANYLGLLGYARMPLIIASLLGGVLTLILGDQASQLNLSLAVLAPEGSSVMLKAALGTLNPFVAWYYFVLATGFGALHRGKAAKGAVFIIVLYIMNLLVTLGGAAIGKSLVPGM